MGSAAIRGALIVLPLRLIRSRLIRRLTLPALPVASDGWYATLAVVLRLPPADRRYARQSGSGLHGPLKHPYANGPPYRICRLAGVGLLSLAVGYLTMASAGFAAGDATSAPASDQAVAADHATEALLKTIVQQISNGHIISPPEDNAMQTWQRVLQRDIETQRSPEVLKALADFNSYARQRADHEKSDGRVLIAAELTVFADQASRMMGRAPPTDAPASTSDVTTGSAQSVGAANLATNTAAGAAPQVPVSGIAPANTHAAKDELPPAPVAASASDAAGSEPPHAKSTGTVTSAAVAAVIDTLQAPLTDKAAASEVAHIPSVDTPVSSVAAAAGKAPQAPSVSIAALAIIPPIGAASQAPTASTTAAVTTGPMVATPLAPSASPTLLSASGAPSSHTLTSAASSGTGEAPKARSIGTATSANDATAHGAMSVDELAGHLPSSPQASAAPGSPVTRLAQAEIRAGSDHMQVAVGTPTTAPQVKSDADNPVPQAAIPAAGPAPEPALAAFYAKRGDALLAIKDISGARKFYEYAANAGSARAATALARTYDASFAAQLDEVGLKPDPELASAWYKKAAALGASQAQLTQTTGTRK